MVPWQEGYLDLKIHSTNSDVSLPEQVEEKYWRENQQTQVHLEKRLINGSSNYISRDA